MAAAFFAFKKLAGIGFSLPAPSFNDLKRTTDRAPGRDRSNIHDQVFFYFFFIKSGYLLTRPVYVTSHMAYYTDRERTMQTENGFKATYNRNRKLRRGSYTT